LAQQLLVQESNSTGVGRARPWLEAAVWALGLVVFFFITYIAAGWLTVLRRSVPSVVFSWERGIPFMPWTIVPYWSTDLFFITAPFLFRTRSGLRTYGKRILAVQIISVAIFLLFPLQFSFGRPPVSGLLGLMFAIRTGIDTQFNQAPSLHIGFAAVMWPAFRQHTRGLLWRAAQVCLVMMSLATLTTYRHHFIDLPTGLWAGVFCTVLISEEAWTAQRRFRVIMLWVLGAILFSWASYLAGNLRWLVLWPAGLAALLISSRSQIDAPLQRPPEIEPAGETAAEC
jgi:hypothetical protein